MHLDTKIRHTFMCSSSSGCSEYFSHAGRQETHPGNWELCVFSLGPLPLLSATEPDAAPALINPLQTAILTGSAAPKANTQSLWPPHLHGAKTLSASVCYPVERKWIQGERPSFTSILHSPPAPRSHTLDRSHHLWMTLFINKIQCPLFLAVAAFVEVKLHLK